jgi:uncharacterized coiled-coil protein SlyX
MTEDRLQGIETALAHAEQQIADLSEMVNLQRREIDALKRYVEMASSRLQELEQSQVDASGKGMTVTEIAARDKPPHY